MAAALPSSSGMAWQFTGDVRTYLGAAGGFLRARPAENTILLTATEAVRSKGPGAFGGSAPLFGWHAEPDGTVTAAFLHTPPFLVVLTRMRDHHADALATALADAGHQVSGVNAAPAPGAAFAAAWQEHTGQAARTGMRMRLYALGQLRPPDNPASNTLYQRLGYRPVGDWAVLWFGAAPEDPRR
jgi:hypothetical protein